MRYRILTLIGFLLAVILVPYLSAVLARALPKPSITQTRMLPELPEVRSPVTLVAVLFRVTTPSQPCRELCHRNLAT